MKPVKIDHEIGKKERSLEYRTTCLFVNGYILVFMKNHMFHALESGTTLETIYGIPDPSLVDDV